MTGDNGEAFPAEINSEEALEEALREIIVEADSNGVDVRGGWSVRTDSDFFEGWDVEVVELRMDE